MAHLVTPSLFVAPLENLCQVVKDFVVAFVQLFDHNELLAVRTGNQHLVELDAVECLRLDVVFVVRVWRNEGGAQSAAAVDL